MGIDDKQLFNGFDKQLFAPMNCKSQMLLNHHDPNVIQHKLQNNGKDFAGDTFSQISSTYELQYQIHNQNQQSHNEQFTKKSVNVHNYKQKLLQRNTDELLDSDILNNSGDEDIHSPMNSNINQQKLIKVKSYQKYSPHSNNNLNNIIMDSEHLQQSTSTLTVYNSGIFDQHNSIMRILDNTISEDFDSINGGNNVKCQQDQLFKYECDDVMQILTNLTSKLKDKLQKCRITNTQSQITTITIDELKQLELFSTSAVEKLRQLKNIGIDILQSNNYRNIKLKQYKENLKIQIHKHMSRYKELCKKQYKRADNLRFKFQINEFDQNQRIAQLEEKLEHQQNEINRQANVGEQMRFQKQMIMGQYDKRMEDIEKMLRVIIKNYQDKNPQNDKQQKISNSFCIGDHSLLMQPLIQNVKNKYIFNQPPKAQKQQQKYQQSTSYDKENESFMSNQSMKKQNLKKQLLNLKNMIIDFKQMHKQLAVDQNQNQESGQTDSVQNLLSNLFHNIQHHDQESRKPEGSQASVNQAFIQSQVSETMTNGRFEQMGKFIQKDQNNTTLDMSFNHNEILFVDGKRQNEKESMEEYINDNITENDLKNDEQKVIVVHDKKTSDKKQFMNSIGSPIDLQLNEGSIGFIVSQRNASNQQNSVEDEIQILNNFCDQKSGTFNKHLDGLDLSDIDGSSMIKAVNVLEITGGNHKGGESFFSGGSSIVGLNYGLYQQDNRGQRHNELIVVKVQNREIQMPKLNLNRAIEMESREKFKGNIQCTYKSSEVSQSNGTSSSSSVMSIMQNQIESQLINPSSFNNDSLSKQMISKHTCELDKAIMIEQNGIALDNSNEEEEDLSNMFGNFKTELENQQINFTPQQQVQNEAKNDQFHENDTIDLDDSNIMVDEQNNKVEEHDMSQDDLSSNNFKRSQSDPSILFNFKEEEQKQVFSKNQIQVNANKIKTPTATGQVRIKFNSAYNQNNFENPNILNNNNQQRKSLQFFQHKNRSSSNNTRQSMNSQNQSSSNLEQQSHQSDPYKSVQLKKIPNIVKGLKLQANKINQSHILNVEQPKKIQIIADVNKTNIQDESSISIISKPKIGKITILNTNNAQPKRNNSVNEAVKPQQQLVQNFFQGAAVLKNLGFQQQKRKQQIVNKNPQFTKQLLIECVDEDNNDTSMIKQLKDFQDSYDMNGVSKTNRNIEQLISPTNMLQNAQRPSNTTSPQKQKKNIIVLNKQVIKPPEQMNQIKVIDGGVKKISIAKRSIVRNQQLINQNMSVLNASVDQSHLQYSSVPNQSIMISSNIDTSMMVVPPESQFNIAKLQRKVIKIHNANNDNTAQVKHTQQLKLGQQQINLKSNIIKKIKDQQMKSNNTDQTQQQQEQIKIQDKIVINKRRLQMNLINPNNINIDQI